MSYLPKSRVVVPVDFSEDSTHALSVALELAGTASNLFLVHVLFPLESFAPDVTWGNLDDRKREGSVKESFTKLMQAANVQGASTTIRFGNPGRSVAEYASELGADLIVVPSHGYHGIKRLMLGSVAEQIIRHAHCSVLVLRRTDAD